MGVQVQSGGKAALGPRAAWAMGLLCAGLGVVIGVAGIVGEGADAQAPRAVVVLGGVVFVLAGIALVKGYALDRGVESPDDVWGPLFGAVITAALASIGTWVALGAGDREFRVSVGAPLPWSGLAAEWLGRVAFGIGAALTWLIAIVFAGMVVARLRRRPARDAIGPAMFVLALVPASIGVLHLTGDLDRWTAARALRAEVAAPSRTDAERLRLLIDDKIAKLGRDRARNARRTPSGPAGDEELFKDVRSRLTAAVIAPAGAEVLAIPVARAPVIDGRLAPGEWDGALVLDLGQGTRLFLRADARRLYLACDVPADTTADGFDQLRVSLHAGLGGYAFHERIHVDRGASDHLQSWRWARLASGERTGPDLSESGIYRRGHGASSLDGHREFEASIDFEESGIHAGVPFALYAEVETDPARDAAGRFVRRVHAGRIGSQTRPVWVVVSTGR